jgi:AcrR family transcriptional regulator
MPPKLVPQPDHVIKHDMITDRSDQDSPPGDDPSRASAGMPGKARYVSKLRERQKEQTARLILDSVATILREFSLDAVSIAEVARVAEVTERTIYRHYATREDMLRAFWKYELERSGGVGVTTPGTPEALYANIRRLFASLDANEGIVRAMMSTPEGRELRRPTNAARFAHMLGFVDVHVPGLEPELRASVAAGIVSVSSVLSWMFMRDNLGMDGARAGEAAATSVEMILAAAKSLPRSAD